MTPVSHEEAYEKLLEEIADVELCVSMLDVHKPSIEDIKNRKQARWVCRLEAADERKTVPENRQ